MRGCLHARANSGAPCIPTQVMRKPLLRLFDVREACASCAFNPLRTAGLLVNHGMLKGRARP